jgi:F0F1-type ATP synthase assembly protein I
LIATQLAVAALAAGLGGFGGPLAMRSAVAGAVICGVANIYAAWRVFASRRRPASEHGELANLYRAEFGKFVMIGAFSAALFAVSDVDILAFVGGCAGAILAGTLIAATFNPGAANTRNTKLQDDHGE